MTFDPITIFAILAAFALGGTLKGATGAGAPIITIPVIAAFYDVRIAVIIMVIPNLLTNISQIYQFRKNNSSNIFYFFICFRWRYRCFRWHHFVNKFTNKNTYTLSCIYCNNLYYTQADCSFMEISLSKSY